MIPFELKKQYYGFCLMHQEEIKDIQSTAYLFQHIKSGARLFYLKNEDDNKVFFISFKTPPENDCGTAHILEHSVLCGSKKYQAKDPFNELAKGSLNTYLNALTYGDKTMYPVASRNEKDFSNLVDVYMDAVLNPRIYEKKEIFMQEGWHYHLEKETEPIIYKGVVYNEMKGALSDPERILSDTISKSLFPNTIYHYESGGDPEAIPDLTYENFLKFHQKYYHPSNSYLYLYGNMDIEQYLAYLDEQYLSNYTMQTTAIEIAVEKSFEKPVVLCESYPVSSKDETQNSAYLSYNVRVGLSTNGELMTAFDLLNYILLGTNASPLKKALIEKGIAQDVEGWFDSSSYEMVFSIIAKKSEELKKDIFIETIEETLKTIVKNGLDKKLIESSLNIWEFHLKEENFGYRPKGLVYGMQAMKSWLHGGNPSKSLKHWTYFNAVKKAVTENYFEALIEKWILNNKNKSIAMIVPEAGKQTILEEALKEKLEKLKNSLTETELKQMCKETQNLLAYQAEKDSDEVIHQIPFLSISEVNREAECFTADVAEQQGCKIVKTILPTNGILYSQFLFDIKSVPDELISYVGLLTELLGKLGTKKYSFEEIPLQINQYTGGLSFSCDIYARSDKDYTAAIVGNGKVLDRNIDYMMELFCEIIFHTSFEQMNHIKNLVKEAKAKQENYLLNNGHLSAVTRGCSYFSEGSKIKDFTSGIAYGYFLSDIEKELETRPEQVIKNLKKVMSLLFVKNNLLCMVGCEEKGYQLYEKALKRILEPLPNKTKKPVVRNLEYSITKEGLTSVSKVQYNVKAADYKKFGFEYSGKMQVLKTIINLEYLWNKVRVQGGAYGCGCNLMRNGNLFLYSYRDPNIEYTLESYNAVSKFLEQFQASERDMTKYILGSVNVLDRPKSNAEKTDIVLNRYLNNITQTMIQKEREELLSTTIEEVKQYSDLFTKAMEEDNICVIGNEKAILKQKALFQIYQPYLKK